MAPIAKDIKDPLARIKDSWDQFGYEENPYFDASVMAAMHPHSATVHGPTQCTATFLLTVPVALCNRANNLHGGAAATLFDMTTSFAMGPLSREGSEDAVKPPFWPAPGVSRTLNCTYLLPVPLGAEVAVVCEVLGMSKRLASIRGGIYNWDKEKGQVVGGPLVVCEHGKVNSLARGTDGSKL